MEGESGSIRYIESSTLGYIETSFTISNTISKAIAPKSTKQAMADDMVRQSLFFCGQVFPLQSQKQRKGRTAVVQ